MQTHAGGALAAGAASLSTEAHAGSRPATFVDHRSMMQTDIHRLHGEHSPIQQALAIAAAKMAGLWLAHEAGPLMLGWRAAS